jgi:hypothetical protein
MRVLCFFFAVACGLSGCPPIFPECPSAPSMDYASTSRALVGIWEGESGYADHENRFVRDYDVVLVLKSDRTFSLTMTDSDATTSARGFWAVDPSASPSSRLQLSVACGDGEIFSDSTWHRGVYYYENNQDLDFEFLAVQVVQYPGAAPLELDFSKHHWRLLKNE